MNKGRIIKREIRFSENGKWSKWHDITTKRLPKSILKKFYLKVQVEETICIEPPSHRQLVKIDMP